MGFMALHSALSGVRAAQLGLETTSNNVSNANTAGYTRQRIEQRPDITIPSRFGPIGTGTDVIGISRIRDAFLDARARTTGAVAARADVAASLLRRAEQVMGEPDSGVTAELDALWNAFEDLANDPSGAAPRRLVYESIDALAGRLRSVSQGWTDLRANITDHRDETVREINGLLSNIAEIDQQVRNLGDAPVPSDLLDQRDLLVDQATELTGAAATVQPDGSVLLRIDGADLVRDGTAHLLSVSGDQIQYADTGAPLSVGGTLGGLTDVLATSLPALTSRFDTFVADLADALNARHADGYVPGTTTPGGPLLAYDPLDPAGTVAAALGSPADIATAAEIDPDTGVAPPYDGRNAAHLAALRTEPTASGASVSSNIREIIATLASDVANTRRVAEAEAEISAAARLARSSMHGVSMDEEMVALVQYQRALEATTRVMTTVDQALDVLVNRTGIVGR